MKVHKVVLLVVDTDNMGAQGIREVVESDLYPNHCIGPRVMSVDTREVAWRDDHPLNLEPSMKAEFDQLFRGAGDGTQANPYRTFQRAFLEMILHEISKSLVQSSTLPEGGFHCDQEHLAHIIKCLGRIRYIVDQAIGGGDIGPTGSCFSGSSCRSVEGTVSCADCDLPRAYLHDANYSAGIATGAVLVNGVPMRTITDPSEPVGVVTICRRSAQGPITPDNVTRETYTLPGYAPTGGAR